MSHDSTNQPRYCSQDDAQFQYAQWYHTFGYSEENTNDYLRLFQILFAHQQVEKVLELGCGDGRISHRLAECGYQVTGVDSNKYLLQMAIDGDGNTRASWLLQDINMLDVVENSFDACLMINGLLVTFPENKSLIRLFQRINKALVIDGLFILELPNLWYLMNIGYMASTKNTEHIGEKECRSSLNVSISPYENIYNSFLEIDYYEKGNIVFKKKPEIEQFSFPNPRRIFTPRELELLGLLTGFKTQYVWGDIKTCHLFGVDAHRQIIAIYKKERNLDNPLESERE